jgi:hypothetical protein
MIAAERPPHIKPDSTPRQKECWIDRQPAVSDPTHAISANYKHINSNLDVVQGTTKAL